MWKEDHHIEKNRKYYYKKEKFMNYKLFKTTLNDLKNMFYEKQILEGNYVFIIQEQNVDFCIVISVTSFNFISQKINNIIKFFEDQQLDYLFLIEPKLPPTDSARNDEIVTNAIFKKEYLDEIIKYDKPSSIEKLCYLSAKSIIDKKNEPNIMARSYEDLSCPNSSYNLSSEFTVIIPHQGDLNYLDICLSQMHNSMKTPKNIWVYFDEEIREEHISLASQKFSYVYRAVKPFNLGPYVARNHGYQEANSQYLCFQDSDDIPTKDRFIELYNYVVQNPFVEMAGCHELRIDEIQKNYCY